VIGYFRPTEYRIAWRHSLALFRAQTAREVMWRGVRYILTSPHTILLRVYRPLAMLVRAKTKALDRDVKR